MKNTISITAAVVFLFVSCLAQAQTTEAGKSIEKAVEQLRNEMVQKSLEKLITSCESATASLLISQDPEQYQDDVFDAVYQVTNVVSRRRPKTTADLEWFQDKLPFCPFRLESGQVKVVDYKASGLGFVVIEGRVYRYGISPDDASIINGKVLRFQK